MAAAPPTPASASTSAAGGCWSSARSCSPASPTTSSRWRGSPARRGSRRRSCTTTSPASRRTSPPRWRRRPASSPTLTETDPSLPPLDQLTGSLDAFLGWVEDNREAYGKLVRSAAAIPEVREVVDRVREMTSARILEGISPGGGPPPPLRAAVRAWLWFMDGAILDWVEQRDLTRDQLKGAAARDAAGRGDRGGGHRHRASAVRLSYWTPSRSITNTSVSFGADRRRRALLAVGEVGRDHELPAAADLHALDALVPARDDLAGAELEGERLAAVPRGVELAPVGDEMPTYWTCTFLPASATGPLPTLRSFTTSFFGALPFGHRDLGLGGHRGRRRLGRRRVAGCLLVRAAAGHGEGAQARASRIRRLGSCGMAPQGRRCSARAGRARSPGASCVGGDRGGRGGRRRRVAETVRGLHHRHAAGAAIAVHEVRGGAGGEAAIRAAQKRHGK